MSAKRLAGSKGNPPRLADEESTFDREPTANWGPGAPRILPSRTDVQLPQVDFVTQAGAARVPGHQHVTFVPPPAAQAYPAPATTSAAPSNPELRKTPLPRRGGSGKTRPPPLSARTALGYTSLSGAQSAVVRLGLSPAVSSRLGRLVDRVVPSEFHIDPHERRVLNALGEAPDSLTARAIGHMLDLADAVSFMEELTRKLESFGLDLVEPGEPVGTEPTYRLRR
jgi:hypothetical protein